MVGIFETTFEALGRGELANEFAAGASAAVISAKSLVREAWRLLLQNPEERLPWESSMIDISRNHHGGRNISDTIGDAYYFKPGHHAHFARKLELSRTPDSRQIECHPDVFVQGESSLRVDDAVRELCWRIGSRIMLSLIPSGSEPPEFRVAVQRLKYQRSSEDFEQIFILIKNSLGGWARFGYVVDARRDGASGFLAPRGVSDLYALLSMMPALGSVMGRLNALCARYDHHATMPGDTQVIGKAHIDGRYFSGLSGARDAVRTEIFVGNRWVELPIGLDSIAVLPGRLAQQHFDIRPTLHRVLHENVENASASNERDLNVTLLIGAR